MAKSNSEAANAHHEAGHAVAATVFGIGLIGVDIRPQLTPTGGMGMAGADFARPSDDQILGQGEAAVMPYLVTFFAGSIAEKRVNPEAGLETGPHSDGAIIQQYAAGAVCVPARVGGKVVIKGEDVQRNISRITAFMEAGMKQAENFVERNGVAIDAVAALLLKKKTLTGAEVTEIVAANPPSAES